MKRPIGIVVLAIVVGYLAATLGVAAIIQRRFSFSISLVAIIGSGACAYAFVLLWRMRPRGERAVWIAGASVLLFFLAFLLRAFIILGETPPILAVTAAVAAWIGVVRYAAEYARRYTPRFPDDAMPSGKVWGGILVGMMVLLVVSHLYARSADVRVPADVVTYNLVSMDRTPAPWTLMSNPVQTMEQISGLLQLEAGKSEGKAWTTSVMRTSGRGFEPETRKVVTKDERFVIRGDSLQLIAGSRCMHLSVFTVAENGGALRWRGYRESGKCDGPPAEIQQRLRALRERPREYRLRQ